MPKQRKQNYEVSVTAFATVVVKAAASDEQAMEFALDWLDLGDMNMDDTKVKCVLKTDEELKAALRHADAVAEDC